MNKKNNCVLLIEDNRICQKVSVLQLERLGYAVELAETGKQAIALIEKKTYCAIISDLSLPDISGEEIIKFARKCERSRFTPFILQTAQETFNEKQYYLDLGADIFLLKPISLGELKQSIEKSSEKYIQQGK